MNIYDFDKTIYDGDSTADFYIYCLKKHKKILLLTPSLVSEFIKLYIFKQITKTQFKEKMYRFLIYCDIDKDLEDFWKKHKCRIKRFYIENQKPDDIIISASPYFLLAPICEELNIKHLIASQVDKNSGKYSGVNCHGEEKVKRLNKEYGKVKVEEFYSDSYSDTPLALLAEKAYIVKGEKITDWKF